MSGFEAALIKYLRDYGGLRTPRLAGLMFSTTGRVRKALLKLESDGVVERNEHYSASNSTYWQVREVQS